MGLLSGLFSKEACAICGKEEGFLGRTKLNDGNFICTNCRKECSAYFQPVSYDIEQVKKHIEYMKMQEELYHKEYETIPVENKVNCYKMFSDGIIFADSIGMFEVITSTNKNHIHKELFRYDDIWDFKQYYKNAPEGSNKKYSEVGVKIKMMTEAPTGDYHTKHYITKYAKEFTFPEERNTDSLDVGFLYKHLNEIMGITISTTINPNNPRTEYRNLVEVNRLFNRNKFTELADAAEKRVWGKTGREIFE